jgi:hypothetical protein
MSRYARFASGAIAALLLVSVGCRGGDVALDNARKSLAACDYGDACAAAVVVVTSMDDEKRASEDGLAARLDVLRILAHALVEYPQANEAFLSAAGIPRDRVTALLHAEADALVEAGIGRDAMVARQIVAFQRTPDCDGFVALSASAEGGGRFARGAQLAIMTALGQLVTSVDPGQVEAVSEAARNVLGCLLPERIGLDASLVEARNRFYDLVDDCPVSKVGEAPDQAVAESCRRAREAAASMPLPLPFPDSGSGDLAGAMLPMGRAVGLSLSPPWVLTVSAGRALVLDQRVLPPGRREAGDSTPQMLIDLRERHRIDDVAYAANQLMKDRQPVMFGDVPLLPIAVDRSTTFSDLGEILDALVGETDAHPALAVVPAGGRRPLWIPIQYRYSWRPLIDPEGVRRGFDALGEPLDLVLTPFSLGIRTGQVTETAEIAWTGDAGGARSPDLRDAYRRVAARVPESETRPARMEVAPAVTAELLAATLDTLAARIPQEALSTAGAFSKARSSRKRGGALDLLVPLIVLRRADTPPE